MKMGFDIKENRNTKRIEVPKDFTNAMFFGRTGSGKTTGAILPVMEDRIKSDYGLLVYDFKGNLHLQTKYLANKYKKLNNVDAIVFTAGLGENGAETREEIISDMEWFGIKLDKEKNKVRGQERIISTDDSKVKIIIIPTNEELMIARDTLTLLK